MNRNGKTNDIYLFMLIMIVPISWGALLSAPYLDKGMFQFLSSINIMLENPFRIQWCQNTLKTLLIFLLIYFFVCVYFISEIKNTRRKEEYGSAKWADSKKVNKKYQSSDSMQDKILTQRIRMGLDGKIHRRNLNTIIVGGSGSGKTRFYAKPNLMQCNTSFVVLDPKGELLKSTGKLLEKQGYGIKVINLIDFDKSDQYNPFCYIQNDNDILKMINGLIRCTTPKNSQTTDPFWEKSEIALLEALCLYLYHEAPPDEQNFSMVMEMLSYAEVNEEDSDYHSPLDILFERLSMHKPNSLAVKQYKIFKQATGKTAKSILVSVGVRLATFNLESIAKITNSDNLELTQLGEKKIALFAVIPDNDMTFNFLISMLYTQLFQMLYYQADVVHNGELPVPVHFLMDEFANVALPDDFKKLLATMRSRGIFVSIIIQNLAQIKSLFKDNWESIVGNCDTLIYLGGNEQSTHKFISEYLGKETLDTNTYGRSYGRSGNYSTNYQQAGRELLTPDEVRLLNNDYALVFIRGERAVMDQKYDILKHPRLSDTTDGGAGNYHHNNHQIFIDDWYNILLPDFDTLNIFSEEDLQEVFEKEKQNGGTKNEI